MENAVKSRLQSVQLGEAQMCKNIANVPLIAPADGTFQYRTLGQAVAAGDLVITKTSANGSISELMVVNRDNKPVLLFDGEELAGAKQNLVLNASILLKEASETKIPVNRTEQGRWSYASKAFSESGNDMAYKSRSKKTRSVHSSLEGCGASMSDQGEVWEGTAYFRAKVCDPCLSIPGRNQGCRRAPIPFIGHGAEHRFKGKALADAALSWMQSNSPSAWPHAGLVAGTLMSNSPRILYVFSCTVRRACARAEFSPFESRYPPTPLAGKPTQRLDFSLPGTADKGHRLFSRKRCYCRFLVGQRLSNPVC